MEVCVFSVPDFIKLVCMCANGLWTSLWNQVLEFVNECDDEFTLN